MLAVLVALFCCEKIGEKSRVVAVEGVTCCGEIGVVLWLLYGHECCLWWGGLSCNLGLFGCRWAAGGEYGGGAAEASVQRMRSMEVENSRICDGDRNPLPT